MGFESILSQIFQPYFYYSAIFLVVSFVCVKILTKYCNFISQRTKSLLYLVPLALPLAVMLIFVPSTGIQTSYQQIKSLGTVSMGGPINSFPVYPFLSPTTQTGYMLTISTGTILSVTGIICLVGLVAGALFALSMVLADDRLARKVLHVILLSPSDYQWLQANVAESSKKLAIATPRIGVVEDLRPNAFTIGYGKRAAIVFSIGLFNILSKEEIIAVASHELAHVKNNDFFFKTLSNALTTVSFFNPLSYISSSSAQREREMFADERAITLLEKPTALGDALAKICKAIQNLPKESMLVNFSSNLLITSSVLHRVGILSTHPRLETRLRNISAPKPRRSRWNHRNTWLVFLLSVLLIASAVAVSLAMADLQVNFTANFASPQYLKSLPADFKVTSYTMGSGNSMVIYGVATVPFNGTQQTHELINQSPVRTSRDYYVETGNNGALYPQQVPVQVFFVVPPQNLTYASLQPSSSAPERLWIG
jgi:Zn-dependent protease with chaperone function